MKKLIFLIKTEGKSDEEIAQEVMEELVEKGILVKEQGRDDSFDKMGKKWENIFNIY